MASYCFACGKKLGVFESGESICEDIIRINFAKNIDEPASGSLGFSPDRVLRILLNSQRDIEQETRDMILHLRDIYEKEDQISFVRRCLQQLEIEEQCLIRELF